MVVVLENSDGRGRKGSSSVATVGPRPARKTRREIVHANLPMNSNLNVLGFRISARSVRYCEPSDCPKPLTSLDATKSEMGKLQSAVTISADVDRQ